MLVFIDYLIYLDVYRWVYSLKTKLNYYLTFQVSGAYYLLIGKKVLQANEMGVLLIELHFLVLATEPSIVASKIKHSFKKDFTSKETVVTNA